MVGDHIIVTCNLPEEEFAALNRRLGAEVRRQIPNQNTWLVSFPHPTPDTVSAAVVEYARALGPNGSASPDHVVYPAATPNDPGFGNLWGMNTAADHDIDAPEAWNYTTGDSSVIVQVIDTGVDYTHPDLAANMWTNPGEIPGNSVDDDGNGYVDDIYGYDFYNWDNNPMDDHGHGTHCSGTIGGVGNNGIGVAGVCWNVRIMAGKFIGASGYGYDSGAMAAVYYGTAKGITLSSNSWGGGGYDQSLKDSIDAANAAGILMPVTAFAFPAIRVPARMVVAPAWRPPALPSVSVPAPCLTSAPAPPTAPDW
ncbi:MAG: S8 family serine peptidase [Kiritimatiellia bacterium]